MPSFDITSKTDVNEVDNALNGISREISQRFDFKGSSCTIERSDNEITILADDDLKLKQMHELLKVHFTRRKLDAGACDFKTVEKASGNKVRQVIEIKQGIDKELAKKIVKDLKGSKLKVQVAIQGDELRVTGKKIDDLQSAIAHVKDMGIEQPLQYDNFRS
ncbi:YajQ family cyclic di-GMP-binding protein [Denitrobaculum tricleocarpae]|uniref:Nucleotide-binding protein FKG95_17805 n=1 Tax=Denitrobaculum tricleocarpae TaxID=2591009 RepID=A0A545TMG6_9PROT|nr:YajQ family cyclic di-GMP-binding protein [Denitrobaculum tricleocarpae]TQV78420.1 YajQ family cyclic di-GMP-binding protein [Denitrobaculum tricleocarpae]